MIALPALKQTRSPNFSARAPGARPDKVVVHMTEGGYLGSIAWLCLPKVQASANYVLRKDGLDATQLVPLAEKAWAQCDFNDQALASIECEGFTAQGVADVTLQALAALTAWHLVAYGLPCRHAEGGQGAGFCSHHDLGARGGGHVDICGVNDATWRKFAGLVQAAHDEFDALAALPAWGLHGAPAPHMALLPPPVTPEPSHGAQPRNQAGDIAVHATPSGWPIASIGDWQWRLAKAGANPALAADDVEGAATRAAIGAFQRACGLPVTNDTNPTTWAKLEAVTA